jgi:hypothetical protein
MAIPGISQSLRTSGTSGLATSTFPVAPPSPAEFKVGQTILWRVANQRFAFHIHVEVQTLPPDPGTLIPFPPPKDSAS